ncbi:unnamed protein product [Rhodiola kirilowii]
MPLSSRFVLESLRMSSIISFTFREAVADVEYNGYIIPKGWKVMPLFRNIHHIQSSSLIHTNLTHQDLRLHRNLIHTCPLVTEYMLVLETS